MNPKLHNGPNALKCEHSNHEPKLMQFDEPTHKISEFTREYRTHTRFFCIFDDWPLVLSNVCQCLGVGQFLVGSFLYGIGYTTDKIPLYLLSKECDHTDYCHISDVSKTD